MDKRKDEIVKTVQIFLRAAMEKGVQIDRAFLFGSWARGESREDSDIDIAVISNKFSGNRINDAKPLDELIWDIDVRIEPITFRPEDFDADDPLASQILRYGIEVPVPKAA